MRVESNHEPPLRDVAPERRWIAINQGRTNSFASSGGKRYSDPLVAIFESRHDGLYAFQLVISKLQLLGRITSRAPGRDSWTTVDNPRGGMDDPPCARYYA
jgi:hypothetical protein